MPEVLSVQDKAELLKRGFTRRALGRFATLLTAGATLPLYNESALAQLSDVGSIPPDAGKMNANEKPLGPCPEAAEAVHSIVEKQRRYLYEEKCPSGTPV